MVAKCSAKSTVHFPMWEIARNWALSVPHERDRLTEYIRQSLNVPGDDVFAIDVPNQAFYSDTGIFIAANWNDIFMSLVIYPDDTMLEIL